MFYGPTSVAMMRHKVFCCVGGASLILLFCGGATIAADATFLGPPGLPAARFLAPTRPVASIISDRWQSEDSRERVGEASRVMEWLGIRPGMVVADIGAGSGYYTVRLAAQVGPSGRVLAQDVMPAYLAGLQERVRKAGLANVSVGLGEFHDARLPQGAVDVALMIHMYHEISQPFALLANLVPQLKAGGGSGSWMWMT